MKFSWPAIKMSSDVLVIGAGVCGLTAIKACLEEGLNPVCFERYDDLGEVTVTVCKHTCSLF